MSSEIPVEFLRSRLRADENGEVFWLHLPGTTRGWNKRFEGRRAGCVNCYGYVAFTLSYQGVGFRVLAHRVVWALTHGEWPKHHIDHINRIKTDNRPGNLRAVSIAENNQNKAPRDLGMGVYLRRGKFIAQRKIDGELKYLGTFNTQEEAQAAYWSGIPGPRVRITKKLRAQMKREPHD